MTLYFINTVVPRFLIILYFSIFQGTRITTHIANLKDREG